MFEASWTEHDAIQLSSRPTHNQTTQRSNQDTRWRVGLVNKDCFLLGIPTESNSMIKQHKKSYPRKY
jgi:hypothetical protein